MLNIYQELLQNNIIVESFEDKNEENMDIQFRIDIAEQSKVLELLEKKYQDYKIRQTRIVKLSIVGYGIIQDNIILNKVITNFKKHKIEIIDINLAQSKIEIIVKNIENDILEELHKELIRNEKEEIK